MTIVGEARWANEAAIVLEATGRELTFDSEPKDRETLRVEVASARWETTRTYNAMLNDEKGITRSRLVRPRGDGWQLHDSSAHNYTTWRRRRK